MKLSYLYLIFLCFTFHLFSMQTREIILPGQEISSRPMVKIAGFLTGSASMLLGAQALYLRLANHCSGDLCSTFSIGSICLACASFLCLKMPHDEVLKTERVPFEMVAKWLDKSFKSQRSIRSLVKNLRTNRLDSVTDKMQKNRREYSHVTQKIILLNGGYINQGLHKKGLPAEICQMICVPLLADLKERKKELATLHLTQEELKNIIELRGTMKMIRLIIRSNTNNSEYIEHAEIITNLDRSYRNQLAKAYLHLRLPHYSWQTYP